MAVRRCVGGVQPLAGIHAVRTMQTQTKTARDHVLEVEIAGEEFYKKLAQTAPEPLDEVFSRLAAEEHEHHETLSKAFDVGNIPVLHESDIADVAHNIYKSIEKDRGMSKDMKSLLDIYIQARDMEAKNRDHYFKLAEEEKNPEAKKLWEFMALEEHKHYKAMDEMVKFVTDTDVWYYW
uniref:Rubrerythrin diiron-binding domain-containing protein n=1 Tax=Eutreptiella gymnastica TaxID=73025 RepID=A0A7S4CVU3_9EUGL